MALAKGSFCRRREKNRHDLYFWTICGRKTGVCPETFGYTEADFSTKQRIAAGCFTMHSAGFQSRKSAGRAGKAGGAALQKRSRHRNGNRVRCRADRCCRAGGKRSSRTAVDSACKTGAESHSCLVRPAGKPSITDVWTGRQQGRCGRNERKIWSRR